MNIIFCSDDFDRRKPDEAYAADVAAVERVGGQHFLINFDALVNDGDAVKAVRRVPERTEPCLAIYRGWMLKPSTYSQLYEALAAKGLRLINDPAAYVHCHHLPESYSVIEKWTPRSVWLKIEGELDMERIMALLQPFGSAPLVLKDYVKSRKHEWDEACFISSASDRTSVERVVRRFLELVDDDLNEGLVFREFVEFEPLTHHSKSGMPLTKEFRLFFLDGKPLFWTEYWEEGDYAGLAPPVDQFTKIAAAVKSRFFTMDIAKRRDGDWMIVELGDAQVAGLPENADVGGFYRAIAERYTPERSAVIAITDSEKPLIKGQERLDMTAKGLSQADFKSFSAHDDNGRRYTILVSIRTVAQGGDPPVLQTVDGDKVEWLGKRRYQIVSEFLGFPRLTTDDLDAP